MQLVLAHSTNDLGNLYVKFLEDGLALGHSAQYYQTVGQRFLGDEGFIEEVT